MKNSGVEDRVEKFDKQLRIVRIEIKDSTNFAGAQNQMWIQWHIPFVSVPMKPLVFKFMKLRYTDPRTIPFGKGWYSQTVWDKAGNDKL